MKRDFLITALAFVCLLCLKTAIFAQGSLTPPGAPAPTMKTLNQIEGRTVIDPSVPGFTTPYTISQPGSYYLSGNINISNGTGAIVISADNVALDLNGFALISTSNPAAGSGVLLSGTRSNVQIHNGTIHGQVVYSGGLDGTFSGGGFVSGVIGAAFQINVRVIDLVVSQCLTEGILLNYYGGSLVDRCSVRTVSYIGIQAGAVSRSSAVEIGWDGIVGYTVSDSRGNSVRSTHCGIAAQTVTNSFGSCAGGTGIGTGTGGLLQHTAAMNSYGDGDAGISVETVTNCSGIGITGPGIQAQIANNSEGKSTSGIGLQADLLATNCRGTSTSGTGLDSAVTANACFGSTGSASAVGLKVGGTANVSGGQNTAAGGVAIQALNGIGCSLYGGSSAVTNKFLGTP